MCRQKGGSGTVWENVFEYRCSRCGGCYACEHELRTSKKGALSWKCRDNYLRPVIFDTGVSS